MSSLSLPDLLLLVAIILILWALVVCGMSWLLMLALGFFGVTIKYWQAIVLWVVISGLLSAGKASVSQ